MFSHAITAKIQVRKIVRRVHCTCEIILRLFCVRWLWFVYFASSWSNNQFWKKVVIRPTFCKMCALIAIFYFFEKRNVNWFIEKLKFIKFWAKNNTAVSTHLHNNIKIFEEHKKGIISREIKDNRNEWTIDNVRWIDVLLKINCDWLIDCGAA